ncbi:glycoside hydrolase family 66 protein [Aggregatilinea lenta]|uniref:glycoside hydrolase family 66 protein n=1 Tax=Aggregatilinea lenta TaxID=913108 RepID=UPI000E5C42BF|nr:glycoside hydrolase family 66 protein [Aggregatilinea lenta]
MIAPTHAFFRPGEQVVIPVGEPFQAEIWHLGDRLATIQGEDALRWQPPVEPKRGYRVRIQAGSGTYWTAYDVLARWTDAPRYGYLFDFKPDRASFDLDWLLAHHVNGIQFYDWQYRHDDLLPPADEYVDPLDRPMSLATVRKLIDAAHARGIVAMPYTAIYGASPAFAAEHLDWGLYDENGVLYDFADGFLKLVNPASPWREHFAHDCVAVLDAVPFDGIHVDQYGEPFTGFDAGGAPVDLPAAFVGTLQAIREAIPPEKHLLFNMVHNWPLDAINTAPLDFLYCELWPPMTTLGHLAEVAALNRQKSGGRTPVIAAYIDPVHEVTVRLAASVILASGGYHLIYGEDGLYLSDPYFPLAKRPSAALDADLQRLADFGVAYEELLSFADPASLGVTAEGGLWVIARRAPGRIALNVLNAQPAQSWNDANPVPQPQTDISIELTLSGDVARIWWVSPDTDSLPQPLDFTQSDGYLRCAVPVVDFWTLVCIELKEA